MLLPEHNRYPLLYLFLPGVVLALLIPLFWNITIEPPQGTGAAGRSFENTALYQRVYPQFFYSFEQLRLGDMPLWNPNVLTGVPHQAQPNAAIFQPLHLPFFFLPTERALVLHVLLCYFLMAMFFMLFARSLDVSFPAAMLGGIAYAFSGASVTAIMLPEIASTLVWAPLLFFALREYTRNFHTAFAVLAGLSMGMLLLAGGGMVAVLFLLLALYYALVRTFFSRPAFSIGILRRGTGAMLIVILGFGVGAIQWIPTYFWYLSLDAPLETLFHLDIAWRLPQQPREFLYHLLSTGEAYLPNAGYLGTATLLFAPAAFLHRFGRFESIYFGLAIVVMLFLAVFEPFPLNTSKIFPFFMFPIMFSFAILAALGMDRFFDTEQGLRSTFVRLAVGVFFILVILVVLYGDTAIRGRAILLTLFLLPAVFWRQVWTARIFGCLTVLLLFTDLAFSNVALSRHPIQDAPQCYRMDDELIQEARRQALSDRILFNSRAQDISFSPGIAMMQPIRAVNARQIPLSKDQAVFWRYITSVEQEEQGRKRPIPELLLAPSNLAASLLNHLGARALLIGAQTPLGSLPVLRPEGLRLRPVRSLGDWMLYANDAAYARVRWVPGWRAVADTEEAIRVLLSDDFEGSLECTVETEGDAFVNLVRVVSDVPVEQRQNNLSTVSCTIVDESPDRVVIDVEAEVAGVTLLADTYAAGWEATLDGHKTPILKVNGIFRGVATPPGRHLLVFSYRPLPFRIALYITVLSLTIIVVCGFMQLVRKRSG